MRRKNYFSFKPLMKGRRPTVYYRKPLFTPYELIPTVPVETAEELGLKYKLHENGEAILIPPGRFS